MTERRAALDELAQQAHELGFLLLIARFTGHLRRVRPYPAPLRDFLLQLACAAWFRARWSNAIHDMWIRNQRRSAAARIC